MPSPKFLFSLGYVKGCFEPAIVKIYNNERSETMSYATVVGALENTRQIVGSQAQWQIDNGIIGKPQCRRPLLISQPPFTVVTALQ